ncbi:MAG: hypothetical protein JSV66_04450 [Trueperaceae bacterium]|nr:MAG: hypothetical protein JSV66_04450 [Trueperaceae bacterium]
MRVGFVHQLLWDRYGEFWQLLVADAEAEVRRATPELIGSAVSDPRIAQIPSVAFRLAAAEALALQHTDLLIVPHLNPRSESNRGGGQDPWIASFPEMLAQTVSGLPQILGVPATLSEDIESIAVKTLYQLCRDHAKVRRIWDRYRSSSKPVRATQPSRLSQPSKQPIIAVLSQPWLLCKALSRALPWRDEHLVFQNQFDPASLRKEGWRIDSRLIATDSEVIGATRLFARRGGVGELRMIIDGASGADMWLAKQVTKASHKPVSIYTLQSLFRDDDLNDILLRST